MYDAQILRILLYGSELWGFQQFAVIQQAHMFACKQFVNVSVQTANKLICDNLGRHLEFITSAVRCVKYCRELQIYQTKSPPPPRPPHTHTHPAYKMLLCLQDLGKRSSYHVKELLCRNGFGGVYIATVKCWTFEQICVYF